MRERRGRPRAPAVSPRQRWIPALIVQAQVLVLCQERTELAGIAEGLLHLQNARAGHS